MSHFSHPAQSNARSETTRPMYHKLALFSLSSFPSLLQAPHRTVSQVYWLLCVTTRGYSRLSSEPHSKSTLHTISRQLMRCHRHTQRVHYRNSAPTAHRAIRRRVGIVLHVISGVARFEYDRSVVEEVSITCML
jgi:hypothetical protein